MKKGFILLLSTLMIAAMTACGVNNQGAGTRDGYGTTQYDNQTRTGMMGNRNATDNTYGYGNNMFGNGLNNGMYGNNGMTGPNRGNNMGINNNYSRELARVIANSCTRVKGVDKATAVVYGNDIVIGVQTDNNNNNNNNAGNRDLERNVRQNIQQLAPTMNIHVTSDRNMMTRITNMDRQMGNGNAVQNIGNDFAALVRDIGRAVTAPFR